MGFWDRLLGRAPRPTSYEPQREPARPAPNADEQALDRYRYLLRTAPPEAIEQAHAEAFGQLTPEQRRQVLTGLAQDLPPGERSAGEDPREMARLATRAELRQPGTMERVLGGAGAGRGMGMGGLLAGSLLASVAGSVIGTSIAASFLTDEQSATDGADAGAGDGQGQDAGANEAAGYDDGGGFGGGGFDGGDFGV